MKIFRRFSLILLSAICIFLTSTTLIYESFNTTILKPYETINYLDDSGIYIDVERLIEEKISKKIEFIDIDNALASIIIEDLINKLITEKLISGISMDIQTSLWDYITDKTDSIGIISLVEFNNNINEIYENGISKLFDSNSNFKEIFYPQIEALLHETLDINEYMIEYTDYAEKAKEYYQLLNIFEVYIYITLAFIFILVFVIILNIKKFLNWLGITYIITGLVTLLAVILFNLVGKQLVYGQIKYLDYYSSFESSIYSFIDILINDFIMNLSIFSVFVLFIGLFSLLLSKLLAKKSYKKKIKK